MDYCDLHNHLLPCVDDGSRSLEETLRYLACFRDQGVRTLVFTPHLLAAQLDGAGVRQALSHHRAAFDAVLAATEGEDAYPELHLGQEILARHPEDLERVLGEEQVGLGDSDALLVEFGFAPPFEPEAVIERARVEGRRIVVAHPERYRLPDADPVGRIAGWRDRGALLQVNGGSLIGEYTERAGRTATALLEEGLVDLVASDHHGDFRTHDPGPTARALEDRAEAGVRDRLMTQGPAEVLTRSLQAVASGG